MARLIAQALLLSTSLQNFALAQPGTVQLGITRDRAVEAAQLRERSQILRRRSLDARADTVLADLGNALIAGLYYANITLGTPGQDISVQIDTGSSDLWVPSSDAAICSSRKSDGCGGGSFDSSKSSTFDVVEQDGFNISYVDGSGSTGDYVQDTFSIGGSTLNNFQLGLATDSSIGVGIMGIGYNTSEANLATGNGTTYSNMPVAMVDQGVINTFAYSLWLNDLESAEGQVLFGGIDTKKYTGDLISVDIYPDSETNSITSFTVAWTSLLVSSSSGSDQLTPSDFAEAAILDSGTTITFLPDAIAEKVFEEVGAQISEELGAVVVPCSLADKNGSLSYQFGGSNGPTIKVEVSELVLPLTDGRGRQPTYSNGQTACQLGIQPAGDIPILFGDTFMRSAFVVYDLANNKIGLAQTDFNQSDSNVVAFPSYGAAIPSATEAKDQAQVTQTLSGIPKIGESAIATGSGQATYNPTATGLNAASGLQGTFTGKKKSAAGRPAPFEWSRVVIGAVGLGLMGVGTGLFALL